MTGLVTSSRWPRWLDAKEAAEYVGVRRARFLTEVKAGIWPKPVYRSTRVVRWDRLALDKASDRLSMGIDFLTGDEAAREMMGWRG